MESRCSAHHGSVEVAGINLLNVAGDVLPQGTTCQDYTSNRSCQLIFM